MLNYLLRIIAKIVLVEIVAKTARAILKKITNRGPRKLTWEEEMSVLHKHGFVDEFGGIIMAHKCPDH